MKFKPYFCPGCGVLVTREPWPHSSADTEAWKLLRDCLAWFEEEAEGGGPAAVSMRNKIRALFAEDR